MLSRSDRLFLGMECALILFVCSTLYAVFKVWKSGPAEASVYLVVAAVPAFAALMFVLLCVAVPSLLAVGRLSFPLQITLPVVYVSLLLVAVVIWTTSPLGIVRNREILEWASFWTRPTVLIVTAVAQIIGLWVASAVRPSRPVDSQ